MQGGRDTGLGWILVNSHTDGVKIFLRLEDGPEVQGTRHKLDSQKEVYRRAPLAVRPISQGLLEAFLISFCDTQ